MFKLLMGIVLFPNCRAGCKSRGHLNHPSHFIAEGTQVRGCAVSVSKPSPALLCLAARSLSLKKTSDRQHHCLKPFKLHHPPNITRLPSINSTLFPRASSPASSAPHAFALLNSPPHWAMPMREVLWPGVCLISNSSFEILLRGYFHQTDKFLFQFPFF